jgi:hypothetical protein
MFAATAWNTCISMMSGKTYAFTGSVFNVQGYRMAYGGEYTTFEPLNH